MKFTQKRKEKIRKIAKERGFGKWMVGKIFSEEHKRKIGLASKGKQFSGISFDWNGKKHTEVSKRKMSLSRMGIILSEETRRKISEGHRGEKSYLWKGGITPQNNKIRGSFDYKLWENNVFIRDNYQCQKCGIVFKKYKLVAHHIKNFSKEIGLRFVLENGITFCKLDHKLFHKKYGKKDNNLEQVKEFISDPQLEVEFHVLDIRYA